MQPLDLQSDSHLLPNTLPTALRGKKEKGEREKIEKNENLKKRRIIGIPPPSSKKNIGYTKDQEEMVKSNVGGKQLVTCKKNVTATPNLLAKLFLENSSLSHLKDIVFLDRESKIFEQFLYFLRPGELYETSCEELRVEANYLK